MNTVHGRLPDFLIVGAAKSATTSLHAYLRQHPSIFMPLYKEPHFFSYADTEFNGSLRAKTVRQYRDFFGPARPFQIIGEASTTYLYNYSHTIENIRKVYGADAEKIKIIISLRNPADRVFSHYSMYNLIGLEKLSFDEAVRTGAVDRLNKDLDTERFGITVDYLEAGMYYAQVKAYKEAFPCVHIILYDDIKRDSNAVIRGVFRFLGVVEDQSVSCAVAYNDTGAPRIACINTFFNKMSKLLVTKRSRIKNTIAKYAGRIINWTAFGMFWKPRIFKILRRIRFMNIKRVSLAPDARRRMVDFYRDDIVRLQGLIGRDLSSWLS